IVMCGDTSETFDGEGREYWVQDVSAASENLLLAAHSIGLGAVWCGIYPLSERVKVFSEMLELPENIIPMACICVGYPSGEVASKDKWEPGHIHHEKWSE
ncbi:MAG: nitroreductase family protein, partial [Muribaculaceae bacterium]|nr:nitroreductase family protein [Muribaculaceae bacterium]